MTYKDALREVNRLNRQQKTDLRDELNRHLGQAVTPMPREVIAARHEDVIEGMNRNRDIAKDALTTVMTNHSNHSIAEHIALNRLFAAIQYIADVVVCALDTNSNALIFRRLKNHAGNLGE